MPWGMFLSLIAPRRLECPHVRSRYSPSQAYSPVSTHPASI